MPKLKEANEPFLWHWWKMYPGLMQGDGGFDYDAERFVLNLYEIPNGVRQVWHDKVLMMISVIMGKRKK